MVESVKSQLPEGVTTEEVAGDARKASGATGGVAVVQIITQVCMKGSIEKVMMLIYYLQLTKSISFYSIKLPANAQLYLEETRKFVDGEYIKPEYLMMVFGVEFELSDVLDELNGGVEKTKENKEEVIEEDDEEEDE